jgi:hypothetical protein
MSAYVAVTITDYIIKASIEHPADRIHNIAGEKTRSQVDRETWAITDKQSRLPSVVAISAVPNVGGRMKSSA